MTFSSLVNAILNEINSNCNVKKNLSVNLALVASFVRTAYLVDTFAPSDPVSYWTELLQKLRSSTHTSHAFASVVHIFEPCAQQSFIVNVQMLLDLLSRVTTDQDMESARNEYPFFVQISRNQPTLQPLLPLPLFQLLDSLRQKLASNQGLGVPVPFTHTLPHLSVSLSVPLAAFLLDYSVAYVPELDPAPSSNSFLEMHFFECILTFRDLEAERMEEDLRNCTIMKFSCPVTILQPNKIITHLNELFTRRLKSIRDSTLLKVEIHQTTHTLDRLAF